MALPPTVARVWKETSRVGPRMESSGAWLCEDHVQAHHVVGVLHPQEGFVQPRDLQPGFGRDIAHVVGMMRVAARIRQMKWITVAALHRQSEYSSRIEPLGRGAHDRLEIREID